MRRRGTAAVADRPPRRWPSRRRAPQRQGRRRAKAAAPRAPAKRASATPRQPPRAGRRPLGSVRIAVSPWGNVEVDGTPVGTTPPLNELTLPEGRHQITIRNADFPPFSTSVNVAPGQPVTLQAPLRIMSPHALALAACPALAADRRLRRGAARRAGRPARRGRAPGREGAAGRPARLRRRPVPGGREAAAGRRCRPASPSPRDRAAAHKHLAFVYCTSNRMRRLRGRSSAPRARRPGLRAVASPRPATRCGARSTSACSSHNRGLARCPTTHHAVPPHAARVLGRHRRRRRGVLRQLPEVLRARAHRVAAQPRLRAGALAHRHRRDVRRHRYCGALPAPGPARRPARGHRAAAGRRPRVDERSRSRPGASRAAQRTLLAEGSIRIGCVDAGTFKPRRIPNGILQKHCR